jgi:hypothetical protein
MKMTYICDYAKASLAVVELAVTRAFPGSVVFCSDLDDDRFQVMVMWASDLDMLDDVLAPYLWED